MPWGDRTGPLGFGPMTGRGAGCCAGYGVPGYMNPFPGAFGWRRAAGFGWGGCGWRHRLWATGIPGWAWPWPAPATVDPETEAAALRRQAEWLQSQLDAINERLKELETEKKPQQE